MKCESPKARPPGDKEKRMVCLYCGDIFHFGKWVAYVVGAGPGERLYFCSLFCKQSWRNGREEEPTTGELIHEGSLLRQDDEIKEETSFFRSDEDRRLRQGGCSDA